MYSNRYALMESSLKGIYGIDDDTVKAIISLHQAVYKPQFESAGGLGDLSLTTVLVGTCLVASVKHLVTKIITTAGGTAMGGPVGWVTAIGMALWAVYDAVSAGKKGMDEIKAIKTQEAMIEAGKSVVEAQMSNNPYAKYAVDGAQRAGEILMKTGGNLMDKLDAVSETTTKNKVDSSAKMDDDAFAKKFGFTKNLEIVDAATAMNNSKAFFYYMNGMNEYGNKVIDKEAYNEYIKGFEEFWQENKDSFYLDEKGARAEMLKEYTRQYYLKNFLPMYRKKLSEALAYEEKHKTLDELAAEGRDEFGQVVDKDKYYASMGFNKDAQVTDINKFARAFAVKTGLDLSYNPINDEGKNLLERMLRNKSDEYMKYLPAPVFLMTEDDQKPFIDKAKDPHHRGESQFGRYGKEYAEANAAYERQVANAATGQRVPNRQNVSGQQGSAQKDITDAPDVDKRSGPWKTMGKDFLSRLYDKMNDRGKHLMRLGYIMDISSGKFYRMSADDIKVMPQIVNEKLDDVARKHAEERRQVELRQGRLTRADMTEDEIIESNRRAGLPDDA